MTDSGRTFRARGLVPGRARGAALVLDEPLSFWGGLDATTGLIVDRRHPQSGAQVTGRVLLLPAGRGSSSSSTVLAEAIRVGTAPAGIVMLELDAIVALGALVAAELYGIQLPVAALSGDDFRAVSTGADVVVDVGTDASVQIL